MVDISGLAIYGGDIGTILQDWEQMGVFSYVLPFILIFAVVFAILENVSVFKDKKSLNMVIALAVGLLSLQFQWVPLFFAEIFPRMGVALSVLLAALVLAGAFIEWDGAGSQKFKWIFFGIGAIAFLIVIADSFASFSLLGSNWWEAYGSAVIILLVIVGLIVSVMLGKKSDTPPTSG